VFSGSQFEPDQSVGSDVNQKTIGTDFSDQKAPSVLRTIETDFGSDFFKKTRVMNLHQLLCHDSDCSIKVDEESC